MDNKNNQEPLVSNDGDPTVIAETPAGPSNDVEMKTSLSQEESKTTVSASGKDVVETETDRVSSVPLPSNTTPSSNAKDSTMDDAADIGQTSRNKNEMEEVKGSETTTKDAIEVAEAAVSSKADTSTEDTTTTEQLEAVLAPTTVAAITSSSTNPNNGITGKEVTQHSNDGDSESKQVAAAATTTTTTTDLMDPIDTHAIEELGRRYPKRARERIWDAQAAEDEKKTSTKTKKKKKEEEDTANRNAPPSSPPGPSPDSTVGRYVEQSKLLGTTTGQFYPLNGQIIEYRAAEGRIPGRYAVRWEYPSADGESADFIQEDEWVEEDLQAFDEAASKGNAPIMTYSAYKSTSHSHLPPSLKVALENVRQRYQQIVERDLGESHVLSSLIVVAALEEALQASLQQQQEAEFAAASSDAVTTKKTTTSKPHPPLYYNANPSSYLQPPSYDKSSASSSPQHKKAQMTPTVLAQRLRQGCQWAWAFLQSKQESTPLLKAPVAKRSFADVMITEVGAADAAAIAAASMSDMGTSVAQRRSVRAARLAPTSYAEEDGISTGRARTATPGLEDPNPVQRGGRIAMWWIQALEEKTNGKVPSKDSTDGDNTSTNVPASAKPNKSKKGKKTNSTAVDTNDEDEVMAPQESFDDDVPDEETKDDDDDYTGGDVEQDEDDESLGDVEKERTRLSPVADLEKESVDEDREEEEEEEENEEHFIVWDNPYLPSSFPALLEYLARPKSITMEEVQKAMDDVTLRIRHNKRSADHGIDLSDLAPSDKVILGFEIPDHPSKGKVVLKCVSGETVGELQRLDANTFSRCKFELEVISDEEKAIQIRRKEDILQQEMEFKERKVWDRWRFRGIHEGYSVWPGWEEGALEWVKENVRSEPAHVSEVDQVIEDPKDDEALAKILEESEAGSGGRRRTARRAAATATEGVFYGNQSQLSQKQLMDAMLRIVKANPFQTLIKMQTLVADDSSDPIRRCRIALGKMLYKRNLIARKAVTSQVGDKVLTIDLESGKRLIELNSTSDFDDNESSAAKDLLEYLSFLHENEIKLRELLLKQLSHIPIPVIATAADERVGSLESLDDNDFDDVTSIKWETSGHPLLQKLLYRPPTQSTLGMETRCVTGIK
ncbi:hypothetical protein IV203_034591 [Nitzschia inconspicua]|uniref:Uncharacterized protein n=1 Tax=Nitzschia inconspicua TaxID=303405 RepID=A0A9K3LDH9_9STRA|nr:hypothetical protein IV203_034591 [Nitzschia inconspicua]